MRVLLYGFILWFPYEGFIIWFYIVVSIWFYIVVSI